MKRCCISGHSALRLLKLQRTEIGVSGAGLIPERPFHLLESTSPAAAQTVPHAGLTRSSAHLPGPMQRVCRADASIQFLPTQWPRE